jgi:hypothetical protein
MSTLNAVEDDSFDADWKLLISAHGDFLEADWGVSSAVPDNFLEICLNALNWVQSDSLDAD